MTTRRHLHRPPVNRPGCRPAVIVCLALVLGLPAVLAAAPGRTDLAPALRALVEGRYDQVDQITGKLDAKDPAVVAIRARAAIARGRYAEADADLKAAVARTPASAPLLELGLLQQMLGRAEATATLERVVAVASDSNDPQDLGRAARALRALGEFQEANAAYRDAVAAAPGDPMLNTGWGELFFEKYVNAEAVRSFQTALKADPAWAPALVGLALATADDNPPQAIDFATRALAINPTSVPALVFLARAAVDAGHRAEAGPYLQRALAVNPSSLEAHAELAAIAYVEDDLAEFNAEIGKALAIAPGYGDAYRVAGELAAHNYRFDEAVLLTRKALALDPKNPRTLADLGLHLLRTGDEAGARAALDAAFKADPYDKVTYNLLAMMDTLDTFTTVRDGDLIVRMPKDEAAVLGPFATSLAHQALTALASRYEFAPRGPILIEIFAKHDDFAVRNLGLPGMIGALGACFGRVVTMDSPKARPPGEFQWEATLWHELAHVITLQMSNQRVPRWLTEGISVYEEKRARPEWGREMDLEFADLLNRGKTLKLDDLNAAFTDPETISLAYFEASLLVEHIVTAYGDAGLRRLLRAYGQGMDTDAALKSALDTDFARMQVGFDQALDRMFGPLQRALDGPEMTALRTMPIPALRAAGADHPRSYPVQLALAHALEKGGDLDGAMQGYERAAALVPVARGSESPHARLAAIALERNDRARAIAELSALVAVDFNNIEAARQLAGLEREAGTTDVARLQPIYQRIAAIDPFDADAQARLGRFAIARGDNDAAVRHFETVIAIGPADPAAAFTDLAESYLKAGNRVDAKKQTLAALEIAPTYERAQELLLKLVGGRP